MYDLSGKVALITGAAGEAGLGRAIALRLAADGANIVLNDLPEGETPRSGMRSATAAIEDMGRRALPIYADITDAAQVDGMVESALAHFGRLDILVNNAGAPAGDDRVPVVDLSEEAFDRVQRVNLKGAFLCCRAAARAMLQLGIRGRVINIASTAGLQGVPRYAAYCASKFALRGFSQALALELAQHGITVNAICPGLIATERLDDMAMALAPAGVDASAHRLSMIAQSQASTPLGRLTKTEDIASMAAFLASDQAAYITGQSLSVDGGRLLS